MLAENSDGSVAASWHLVTTEVHDVGFRDLGEDGIWVSWLHECVHLSVN